MLPDWLRDLLAFGSWEKIARPPKRRRALERPPLEWLPLFWGSCAFAVFAYAGEAEAEAVLLWPAVNSRAPPRRPAGARR